MSTIPAPQPTVGQIELDGTVSGQSAALSSLMTLYLVRTAHPEPADEGTDDGTRSPE